MSNPMPPVDSSPDPGGAPDTLSCTCPHCGKAFDADIMPKPADVAPTDQPPDDTAIADNIKGYMGK